MLHKNNGHTKQPQQQKRIAHESVSNFDVQWSCLLFGHEKTRKDCHMHKLYVI